MASSAVAQVAVPNLSQQSDKMLADDIRNIKRDAFMKDLALEATVELKKHMKLEGLDIEKYIHEAIGVYEQEYPEKSARMGKVAQEKYQFTEGSPGGLSRMDNGGLSVYDKIHMMKYLQLKYVALYLQKNKLLGKFCFYGCWCFPKAAGAAYSGYGVPVDNIDKSCHEFTTCYNCIYNPQLIGQRCNENDPAKYNIGGSQNPETGKVALFCTDQQGTCLRSRCECDLDLALKLAQYEDEWSPQNHHKWGSPPFNPQQACSFNVNKFITADASQQQQLTQMVIEQINPQVIQSMANAQLNKEALKEAKNQASVASMTFQPNAESGSRLPGDTETSVEAARPNIFQQKSPKYSAAPIYGPIIGCCGRAPKVHFFRQGQRCCLDGEIVDEKAPCNMDFM